LPLENNNCKWLDKSHELESLLENVVDFHKDDYSYTMKPEALKLFDINLNAFSYNEVKKKRDIVNRKGWKDHKFNKHIFIDLGPVEFAPWGYMN